MNKSPYIGKYDYINYYSLQPSLWFFSHDEILASIDLQYKVTADDDEDTEAAADGDNYEFDSFEYYQSQKAFYRDVDKNDPKIIEGLIIDEKARSFVLENYPGFAYVDLEHDFPNLKNDELAIKTKALLEGHEKIIIFQAVFIAGNLITKPDAIIKDGDEITLIETKGTTTAKLHHFLDVYFQSQVLFNTDYLRDCYFVFKLCLVKYCPAKKNTVPLIITPNINLTKSLTLSKVTKAERGLVKTGSYVFSAQESGLVESPINLTSLCEQDFSDIEARMEIVNQSTNTTSLTERISVLNDIYLEFNNVIKTLLSRKQTLIDQLVPTIDKISPHPNDKPFWKNSDIFPALRKIYVQQGYDVFKYSGSITNQGNKDLKNIKPHSELATVFKGNYAQYFVPDVKAIKINSTKYRNLLSALKSRKVYFDFETINTSIRPIDGCYPFSQIVTQCSIIIDDGTNPDVGLLECNNILIDPINITLESFGRIVDSLHRGPDYSYIVFNKTFEKGRLLEIKEYLNNPEYASKIDDIVNNLFDLADFFRVSKDLAPILIQELRGFYSIKKILAFISDNYPHLFKLTKCKDYLSLPVSNGSVCQNKTMARFYNVLSDSEWSELSRNLKIYCENDVRAMIAVELLIKELKTYIL